MVLAFLQKEYDMGIGAAIAIGVGVAGSAYAGNQQEEAQQKAMNEQKRLNEEARRQEQAILQEEAMRQDGTLETVQFGTEGDDGMGSYDDFLAPMQGNSSTAGLGIPL